MPMGALIGIERELTGKPGFVPISNEIYTCKMRLSKSVHTVVPMISREEHYTMGYLYLTTVLCRATPAGEIPGRVDEGNVGECLREVAHQTAMLDVVLFRQQPDIISEF